MSDLGWILAVAAILYFGWHDLRARQARKERYWRSVEALRRRNEYKEREMWILNPSNRISDEQRVAEMRELRREWRAGS